jgi:hypothetical protein
MTTYTYKNYDSDKVASNYVGILQGQLIIYEVDARGYTIKSHPITPDWIHDDFYKLALERAGTAFNQVKIWERKKV